MRRPAVVTWAAVAVLALLALGAPARSVDFEYDYRAYLGYEDTSGGTSWIPLPISIVPGPDGTLMGVMTNFNWSCADLVVNDCANDGFVVEGLSLTLDTDPQITYIGSFIDTGGPSAFNFFTTQAIVPTAAPGLAEHTLSSNTTDGGSDGVLVTAVAGPNPNDGDGIPEIAKFTLSLDGGGTLVSAGLDLSASFVAPTGSTSQGPFTVGGAGPAGSGSYNWMRIDVNGMMGGGGDRYAFNGRASIEQDSNVPEPGTASLLGMGLICIAFGKRRGRH